MHRASAQQGLGMSACGRSTYKSPTERGFDSRFLVPQKNVLITNPHMFLEAQGSTVPVMEMSRQASCWGSALWGGFQHRLKLLLCSRALLTRQNCMCPWVMSDRISSWSRREMPGWLKKSKLYHAEGKMNWEAEKWSSCVVYEVGQHPFWARTPRSWYERVQYFPEPGIPPLFSVSRDANWSFCSLLSYDMGTWLHLLFMIFFFFSFCFSELRNARTKAEMFQ